MSGNEDPSSFRVERKSVSRTTDKNEEKEYIEASNYEELYEKFKKDIDIEKNKNLLVYPTDRLGIKITDCINNPNIVKSLEDTDKDSKKKYLKDIYDQYKRKNNIEVIRNYPEYEGYPESVKKSNRIYVKGLKDLKFNSFETEKKK